MRKGNKEDMIIVIRIAQEDNRIRMSLQQRKSLAKRSSINITELELHVRKSQNPNTLQTGFERKSLLGSGSMNLHFSPGKSLSISPKAWTKDEVTNLCGETN